MSSSFDSTSPGTMLLHYRLIERLGSSAWKAEDTRSGKAVAVKTLARQLPRDPSKREALIREVRLGGALYHQSLINIIEIVPAGEGLYLVSDLVDGEPLSQVVQGKPLDRTTFFRIVYQVADALKLLHGKGLLHGNVNGDSIIVTPAGQAKLGGFNISTFLQKREGLPSAYQMRGNDPRAVAYMAPEQIANQPCTAQSDVFSLGLVMYEMATGRAAYQGATAAEIAHKIVSEQPPNPKSINPNVDNAVLTITGNCLFKDQFRRYKDAKAVTDAIAKADAEAVVFANEIARAAVAPTAAQLASKPRNAILLVADIENYASLENVDPGAAAKAAARMQQMLGEAVYLFDGQIVDPFGPQLVAELPSIESALEAARKGEFDVSPDQQQGEQIPIRMLLHCGDVITKDGQVTGEAVTKAHDVLAAIPPLRLVISEDFAKKARGVVRLRDIGARAGLKLYEIVPAERKEEPATQLDTAEVEAAAAKEEAQRQAALAAAAKKRRMAAAIAAMVFIVLAGGVGFVLLHRRPATTAKKAPVPLPPATAATPRKVYVTLAGDPAVAKASLEVLRTFPELRLADTPAADVTPIKASAAGADPAAAIQSVVQSVSAQLKLPPHTPSTPAAMNAFAAAMAAIDARDSAKAEAAIRAATTADPNFLPAQILALRFFSEHGKTAEVLDAAKHVAAIDPSNADAAREIARASMQGGDLAGGLGNYAIVLKKRPDDIEALNMIGRYACAVPDAAKFGAAAGRVQAPFAAIHMPDLLLAAGRIDDAVTKLYEIELNVPNNPALSLKIGRIAVLRHSPDIAALELKKLGESDRLYSYHVLKAYIAASSGSKAEASNELKIAQTASIPGDDFWTSAAEVAAIAGDAKGTLDALEKAAARKEPTASYVLANPLFRFLSNEPRFRKVREALITEQNEIRAALANVAL